MNVLCIGAHPDDIELGCGGITTKLIHQPKIEPPIPKKGRPISKKSSPTSNISKTSSNVYWLVMTKGDYIQKNRKIRMREQKAVQELLPKVKIIQGSMPDNYLHDHIKGMVEIIERWIKYYDIDTIITHSPTDTHHDHRAIFTASYEAARKIPNLLCYEEAISNNFNPNLFVEATFELGMKGEMLRCHKSQKGRVSLDFNTVSSLAFHRAAQYMQTNKKAYEAFHIIKIGTGFKVP